MSTTTPLRILVLLIAISLNSNAQYLEKQNLFESTPSLDGIDDIEMGDLDGDGDLDAVIPARLKNKIVCYRNNGDGTFEEAETITLLDNNPEDVFLGDINGDGSLDLLFGSFLDGKVAWHANDGNGNFGAQQIITSLNGARVTTVYGVDLDNDGDLDVIYGDKGNDQIVWCENLGNGVFSSTLNVLSSQADNVEKIIGKDINNDGFVDIVYMSLYVGKIAWIKNLGNSLFSSETSIYQGDFVFNFDIVDFDNNNTIDLIVTDKKAAPSSYYAVFQISDDGSETFPLIEEITPVLNPIRRLEISDITEDGLVDIILIDSDRNILWYENQGNSTVADSVLLHVSSTIYSGVLLVEDVNNDGSNDVIVTISRDSIAWFENSNGAIIGGPIDANHIVAVDDLLKKVNPHFVIDHITNQSTKDVLFTTNFAEHVNASAMSSSGADATSLFTNTDVKFSNDPLFYKDVDQDGLKDVLTTYNSDINAINDNAIIWYKNLGNNSYNQTGQITSFPSVYDVHIESVDDINNDGINDLVTILKASANENLQDHYIAALINDGMGGFDSVVVIENEGRRNTKIKTGDFNADGLTDIVALIKLSLYKSVVYINNGDGTFNEGPTQDIPNSGAPASDRYIIDVADLNGDGIDELFAALYYYKDPTCVHCGNGVYNYRYNIYSYNSGNNGLSLINQLNSWPFTTSFGFTDFQKAPLADVNQDGNIDILSYGLTFRRLEWQLGDGFGNFSGTLLVDNNIFPFGKAVLEVEDSENDGDLDIYLFDVSTGNPNFRAYWYENTSSIPTDNDNDGIFTPQDCDDQDSLVGLVLPPPDITPLNALCEESNIQFQINNIRANSSYFWSGPNAYVSGLTAPTLENIQLNQAGIYTVQNSTSACVSAFSQVDLNVIEAPFVEILQNGNILTATGDPVSAYQWYLNGNIISSATDMTYTFTVDGTYTVEVVAENGCSYLSEEWNTIISGLFDSNNDANFMLYPNPIRQNQVLSIELKTAFVGQISYQLLDILGREVDSGTFVGGKGSISIDKCSLGNHILKIYVDGKVKASYFSVIK